MMRIEDVSIDDGFFPAERNRSGHAACCSTSDIIIIIIIFASETLCHPIWAIKDNFKTEWIITYVLHVRARPFFPMHLPLAGIVRAQQWPTNQAIAQ